MGQTGAAANIYWPDIEKELNLLKPLKLFALHPMISSNGGY